MRRRNILFQILWLAMLCFAGKSYGQHTGSQLLERITAEKKCVGIAAGYSILGETTWMDASGFQDKAAAIPFSSTTVTRIASIAKPMTAIAILQLYEQGKLDLDKPIQTYVPDFPVKKEGMITIRHLLQHSSGIGGYKNKKEQENIIEYATLQDVIRLFEDRDLVFSPGSAFFYTTYGYVVLGLVIENISGMSYASYMKKYVWDVAGMTDTQVEQFNHHIENQSKLYHRSSKGAVEQSSPTNLSDRIPGGGIVSTLGDMLKFGDAILNNTLIKPSSFDLMTEDPKLKTEGN